MRIMTSPFLRNPLLVSLSAMVTISLLVGLIGQGNGEPPARPTAEVTNELLIGFRDSTDGSVTVTLGNTDRELATFKSGEGFFLRGAVRTLVNERRIRSIESQSSFKLEKLQTGSLLLSDPITGYWLALDAFGRDNVGVFQKILDQSAEYQSFSVVANK